MHKITVIIVLIWNVIITNYYCCFDLFTWRHYYSYVITHFATVVFPKCSHHNEFTTRLKTSFLFWLHTRLHVLA